jgi:DNA-binding transcriptional LysR family regulator
MPLTTVSRHLAALEEHLGVRLITRTTRGLALTEPGRNYLESSRRILAELEAASLRITGEQAEPLGELAITAPVVFGRLHVLPVATEFLKAFPASRSACCCSIEWSIWPRRTSMSRCVSARFPIPR